MDFQPGEFVTHRNHPEWGMGEVDRQMKKDKFLVWFKIKGSVECQAKWLVSYGAEERLLEDY